MKLNKKIIFEKLFSYYQEYVKSLEKEDDKLTQMAFDELVRKIMLEIRSQLSPKTNIDVAMPSKACDIEFLAEMEGTKFDLAEFLKKVNFDIYVFMEEGIVRIDLQELREEAI